MFESIWMVSTGRKRCAFGRGIDACLPARNDRGANKYAVRHKFSKPTDRFARLLSDTSLKNITFLNQLPHWATNRTVSVIRLTIPRSNTHIHATPAGAFAERQGTPTAV